MVVRKLNKPLGRIGGLPVFWMRQVLGGQWVCRQCHVGQVNGVAVEVHAGKDGGKQYVCVPCAVLLLEDALGRIRLCEQVGPEMYALMDDV